MLQFRSSTNTAPKKEETRQVIAGPSRGTIKVTPQAYDLLGLVEGDFMQVIFERNSKTVWICQGAEGRGGKLSCSNKSGAGNFGFSSTGAWADLQGEEGFNKHYDVLDGEGNVAYITVNDANEIEIAENGDVEGAIPVYQLSLVETKATTPRKKSAKADPAQVDLEDVVAEEVADQAHATNLAQDESQSNDDEGIGFDAL